MTFWYHMYGNTVGKFAVFGEVDNAELWSKSEDLGTDWQDAKITLTLSKKQKVSYNDYCIYWYIPSDDLSEHPLCNGAFTRTV